VTGHSFEADEIRIGGGELFLAFFEELYRMRAEHLIILAPYVDDGAFADVALRMAWERALGMVEATIIVRTPHAATAILRATRSRQRRCDLRVNPNLHAKVFVAWRPGAEIALVGSQNLTGAALRTNQEIGMLIRPAASGMKRVVSELLATIKTFVRTSSHFQESMSVPTGPKSRSNGAPERSRNAQSGISHKGSVI
jgi:hypothetical protein